MKVKELIEHLKRMPQDFDVVYSSDDEGNSYHKVYWTPTVGRLYGDEFSDIKTNPRCKGENVVCIN